MSEGDITYECVRCAGKMTLKELDFRGGRVKCIHCGYRVLRKLRPPIVKRIKAT